MGRKAGKKQEMRTTTVRIKRELTDLIQSFAKLKTLQTGYHWYSSDILEEYLDVGKLEADRKKLASKLLKEDLV